MGNKKTKTVVVRNGVGFSGLLTLLFIALKLTNVITWSWIWVLAPIWLPWALFFGTLAIVMLVTLIFSR